jgi:hypothetical protein
VYERVAIDRLQEISGELLAVSLIVSLAADDEHRRAT